MSNYKTKNDVPRPRAGSLASPGAAKPNFQEGSRSWGSKGRYDQHTNDNVDKGKGPGPKNPESPGVGVQKFDRGDIGGIYD